MLGIIMCLMLTQSSVGDLSLVSLEQSVPRNTIRYDRRV